MSFDVHIHGGSLSTDVREFSDFFAFSVQNDSGKVVYFIHNIGDAEALAQGALELLKVMTMEMEND